MSSPPVPPQWVCAIGFGRVRALRARTISAGLLVLAASAPFSFTAPPASAQFPIRQVPQSWGPQAPVFTRGPAAASRTERPAAPTPPHPAVARIVVPEKDGISYGSGTLIDVRGNFGLVITNWHVVQARQGEITVQFPDGFQSPALVVKEDKDWDLAALSIARPPATPAAVSGSVPRPGEALTIAGYGSGDYRQAAGRCTQYCAPLMPAGVEVPQEMIELSAEARQGDSGGPIFNQRGELAGVLFGSATGFTTGSHSGRVLQFLTTVVPGGVPGSDGSPGGSPLSSPPATALAVQPPSATVSPPANGWTPREQATQEGLVIGPPPQATALHQNAPADPPANSLPSDFGHLTPASALPTDSGIIAPPAREAVSQRFDQPPTDLTDDIDPKAAVVPDRVAMRTISDDSALTPRVPAAAAKGADLQSAPPDQLLAALWQRIGGANVLDQVKTVLAGIGILSVAILFMRVMFGGRRSEPDAVD